MTVELKKYEKYKGEIALKGAIEKHMGNSLVAGKFQSFGFTNVEVTGSGVSRIASGVWSKEDQTLDLSKMPGGEKIVSIQRI